MKKLLGAILLLACLPSPAGSQSSKATLNTEITTNWPNNTTGAITPALLRTTVSDIVASYVDWLTCTAQGGILYWNATGTPTCLAAGSNGYILKTQGAGADPVWAAPSASTLTVASNFRFIGNNAAANSAAQELSANTLFDWLGTTRGAVLYRGASQWSLLSPGVSGYLLSSQGAGADPAYINPTASHLTLSSNFRFIGNNAAANSAGQELTANTLFDWLSSTRGALLYRGAAQWSALTGTNGYLLKSQGAGADPVYQANTAAALTMVNNFSFIGNNAGANGVAQELTANTLIDWIGATRGNVLYRGAAGWAALAPSTAGFVLQTGGAGADPSWVSVAGTGTVTVITCSTGIGCSPNPITTTGTITADVATRSNIWNGTTNKLVDAAGLNDSGQIVTLTPASPTVAVDFSTAVNFSLALTGSTQLGNPTNVAPGRTGCIFITKSLTTQTLSYNSSWKFAGGTAPTLNTTDTTNPDALCFLVRTSTFIWATLTKAIQ